MVIFGNNLHEKLYGVAISREYLKLATPYCDFVDDPTLGLDIDIAVDFYQANGGDTDAATNFTNTIILSGYLFDWSTKNFYRDKMINNPACWGREIDRINRCFSTGIWESGETGTDSSFTTRRTGDSIRGNIGSKPRFSRGSRDYSSNAFDKALKDCLKSPCNLFAETSDSIGRMAQVASTKNGSNSFSIGSAKESFANIVNGVDEAITKNLPAMFGDAAIELTQSIGSARSNIQAIAAGKKNLKELESLANGAGTLRGGKKVFRYTPDIKSASQLAAIGNNILLKIKQQQGGCFDKFQHSYRYNPYRDNQSVPATVQEHQYNGVTFEAQPNGVVQSRPPTTATLGLGQDGGDTGRGESGVGGGTGNQQTARVPTVRTSYEDDDIYISNSTFIDGKAGGMGNYSVFASSIIELGSSEKYIIVDDFDATGHDIDTLNGKGLNGGQIMIGPSYPLADTNTANSQAVQDGLNKKLGDGVGFLNKYSQNYRSGITDFDMEQLFSNSDDQGRINEGVAVSQETLIKCTGGGFGGLKFRGKSRSYGSLARANEIFIAANYKNVWKLYKVVDANTQSKQNVDFTPAAFYHLFGELPKGTRQPSLARSYKSELQKENIGLFIGQHKNFGAIEFKICYGDPALIKSKLNGGNIDNGTVASLDGSSDSNGTPSYT